MTSHCRLYASSKKILTIQFSINGVDYKPRRRRSKTSQSQRNNLLYKMTLSPRSQGFSPPTPWRRSGWELLLRKGEVFRRNDASRMFWVKSVHTVLLARERGWWRFNKTTSSPEEDEQYPVETSPFASSDDIDNASPLLYSPRWTTKAFLFDEIKRWRLVSLLSWPHSLREQWDNESKEFGDWETRKSFPFPQDINNVNW